jgi:hypothetical protein
MLFLVDELEYCVCNSGRNQIEKDCSISKLEAAVLRKRQKFFTGIYVVIFKKTEILRFLIFIAVKLYVMALRIKRLASNEVMNMGHFCPIKGMIPRQLDQGRRETAKKRKTLYGRTLRRQEIRDKINVDIIFRR